MDSFVFVDTNLINLGWWSPYIAFAGGFNWSTQHFIFIAKRWSVGNDKRIPGTDFHAH